MELGATVCHRHSPLCLTCPVLEFCTSGKAGDAENFPKLQKKKNKKKSIQRYWLKSDDKLLLFTDLHSQKKLSGIYELPQEVPAYIKQKSLNLQSIGIRKRTIGNVDYEEEIIRGFLASKPSLVPTANGLQRKGLTQRRLSLGRQ